MPIMVAFMEYNLRVNYIDFPIFFLQLIQEYNPEGK